MTYSEIKMDEMSPPSHILQKLSGHFWDMGSAILQWRHVLTSHGRLSNQEHSSAVTHDISFLFKVIKYTCKTEIWTFIGML